MITYHDTHCHLNLNHFDNDLDQVIRRAQQQGVGCILIPGIDLPTSRQAVEISQKHEGIFAAVGIHPNNATSWDECSFDALRELTHYPEVVAIGEIGLDYYRTYAEPSLQKDILLAQMQLAAECSKPLVLHNRDALHDLLPILRDWVGMLRQHDNPLAKRPGVLHAFSGDLTYALQAIELGFYIGIAGPITFTNARERQNTTRQIPLQFMLAETDAPYLAPHPYRGSRNEPAWVSLVVQKIAELKSLSLEETTFTLQDNGNLLFGWRSSN